MTLELALATAYLTCGALMLFLGLVVLRENPRQRVNRATAAMLVCSGLGPILGAYANLTQRASGGGAAAIQDVFSQFAFLWEFFFPSVLLFSLVFPRLHPTLKRFPRLSWGLFLPHLFHVLLVTVLRDASGLYDRLDFSAVPLGGDVLLDKSTRVLSIGIDLLFRAHVRFFSFVNLAMAVTSWVLLMRSARRTRNPRLKSQVRMIRLGLGISLALYSGGELVPTAFGLTLDRSLSLPLVTVSLLVGAVSIVVAIVRLGFLDVRFIVRRGLVYGLASGVIVAVYLFVGKQFDKVSAHFVGAQLPVFETTFLVLSLFLLQPALAGIERIVDRTYSRDRGESRNALARLAEKISLLLDPVEVCRQVATTLRRELVLRSAVVVTRDGGSGLHCLTVSRDAEEEPEHVVAWPLGRLLFATLEGRREPVGVAELVEMPAEAEDRETLGEELRRLEASHVIPLWVAKTSRPENGSDAAAEGRELVGVVALGEKVTETRLTFEETSLVELVARQLGTSLVNGTLHKEQVATRLLEEEVATARRIQQQLLPECPPTLKGWEVSASNHPSRHVGGDYHDFLPLGNGEVGIAIADVSGKGVPAALLMSNLQAALRVRSIGGVEPDRVVEDVNRQICRNTGAESFISFFLAELSPELGHLRFTNAGHNAPVLVRRDGRVETLEDGGLLLGVFPEATYESGQVALEPGDCLALYTDGVTEASNPAGDLFSEERLIETLIRHRGRSAEGVHRGVMEEVKAFQEGLPPDDDLTLIVLKRRENGA
jgi:sigma-B regulation protein RsbU (phosphoserine phosphatase)